MDTGRPQSIQQKWSMLVSFVDMIFALHALLKI